MNESQIQQNENPNGNETNEASENSVNALLKELGELEKSLFGGDGIIGGESNDSAIDDKFRDMIGEAGNLEAKLIIIKLLIDFYKSQKLNKSSKNSENNLENNKNLKELINTKVNALKEKYPDFSNSIDDLVKNEDEIIQYYVDFYKKDNKNFTPEMQVGFLNTFLTYKLPTFEKNIEDVMNCNFIKDKKTFIDYYVNNSDIIEGLGTKLNKLFSYKIITEGFNEDKSNKDSFWYGTILRLIGEPSDKIKKLDNMCKNDSDNKEFSNFIDKNFSPDIIDGLLNVKSIKEKYLLNMKEKYGVNLIYGLIDDNTLVQISFLSNDNSKKGIIKILQEMNISDDEKIKSIIGEGGKLDDLINNSKNNLDKVQLIYVIQTYLSQRFELEGEIEGDKSKEDIKRLLKEKLSGYKKISSQSLKNAIEEKRTSLPPEARHRFEDDLKGAGTDERKQLLVLSNNYNSISPGTNKPHNQAIRENFSQLNPNEKTKIEGKMKSLGIGSKVTLDKDGKIVSIEHQKKVEEAIAKGEKPPEEKQEKITENIGHNGKIEFGIDGKMVFTSSLGYKFDFENNSLGVGEALEISETFDYLHKIGIGYFGENFKTMIELIKQYLPNQGGWINIDENNGDFLNVYEMNNLLDIFINIGVIGENQNTDYFMPDIMPETEINLRLDNLGNDNFYRNGQFNQDTFVKLIQSKNKV